MEKHPDISYHLFSGNADDVTERLDQGLLDFGVLIEPADIKKYDFIKLPARDRWGLLMRCDHPLATKQAIKPRKMSAAPYALTISYRNTKTALYVSVHWNRRLP